MNSKLGNFGSKAMRVYDALVPKTGLVAPTMDADFVGQSYTNTSNGLLYTAISTGNGVSDWTFRTSGPRVVAGVPTESADYIGQLHVDMVNSDLYMALAVGNGSSDWYDLSVLLAGA